MFERKYIFWAIVILFSSSVFAFSSDFDNNQCVDLDDFFLFAEQYEKGTTNDNDKFDLDLNGKINLDDFFIFAENYDRCEKKEMISVIIDSETYSILAYEIDRYIQDIKKDLNVNVELKIYVKTVPVFVIKSYLKKLYNDYRLNGVVLIGDLPTYDFISEAYPDGIPSDYYYMDIETRCKYPSFRSSESGFCTDYLSRFWLGRITPPVKGEDGMRLLKDYFERNHNYRNVNLFFNKEILFYAPDYDISKIEDDGQEYIFSRLNETLVDELTRKQIYDFNPENALMSYLGENRDQDYIDKLKKQYEIVVFNGHGTPTFHSNDITSETIKTTKPKALYYLFNSCSIGKFTEDNYLAGRYLFSGNGLVVKATTVVVEAPFPPSYQFRKGLDLLSKGEIFGNADIVIGSSVASTLLGDPTLRLNYNKTKPITNIEISRHEIDFGKKESYTNIPNWNKEAREILEYKKGHEEVFLSTFPKVANITIYNKGTETLDIRIPENMLFFDEPEIPIIRNIPLNSYIISCDPHPLCQSKIEPLSSVTYTIKFSPPVVGNYEYVLDIFSSDGKNYWIRIPISGEGI